MSSNNYYETKTNRRLHTTVVGHQTWAPSSDPMAAVTMMMMMMVVVKMMMNGAFCLSVQTDLPLLISSLRAGGGRDLFLSRRCKHEFVVSVSSLLPHGVTFV